MVREHANSVWCPYKMGGITEIEKVKVQKEQPCKLIINFKKNVIHRQAYRYRYTSKAFDWTFSLTVFYYYYRYYYYKIYLFQ